MKMKMLVLLIVCFAAEMSAYAASASAPTVEKKGTFLKITTAGASTDGDSPRLIYVRRSAIISVTVAASTRSTGFYVEIVTSALFIGANSDSHGIAAASVSKSYSYRFADEAGARSFCEAIVSD